jgi:hypothetical protein
MARDANAGRDRHDCRLGTSQGKTMRNHRLWVAAAALLSTLLFCGAVAPPDYGQANFRRPGGENGGGSGVWVLPHGGPGLASVSSGTATIHISDDLEWDEPNGWVNSGTDMIVQIQGNPIAVVYGFFSLNADKGYWLDISTNETGVWERG